MANGNGKNKKKKRLIWIVSVTLLVLVCAGVLIAAKAGGTKIDPSKLAKVEKGDLAKSVVATGKVTPIVQVEIKSKASGIVKKLYVEYGDRVKQGQILADLDKVEIEAQVRSQKANVEAAEANFTSTKADYERAKVDAEGPDIPMLQRAYERATKMAKDGVVSQSNLDDAQKAYELAINKQNMARAQLAVLKAKIAQADAQVQSSHAQLKQLEEQLSYTTI
jgi:HlyD family secretion protein